jgi:hypothetical protein
MIMTTINDTDCQDSAHLSIAAQGMDEIVFSIPRRLWFDFVSAAYSVGIDDVRGLEAALAQFIANVRGEHPSRLTWPGPGAAPATRN